MMNKKLLLIFISCLLVNTIYAQTPTLHLLLFLDSDDYRLKNSVEQTHARLLSIGDNITKHAEMKKNQIVYKGSEFNPQNLDKTIESLSVGEKDIIFFYFAGHGWNNYQSQFPMLTMKSNDPLEVTSRGLEDIYNNLLKKKARMTLVFAEACNDNKAANPQIRQDGVVHHQLFSISPNKIRTLFRQTKVNIIMASSQKGQKSFSDSNGGYFTNSFCQVFEKMTSKEYSEEPDWESILNEVQLITSKYSQNTQNPIMDINYYEDTNTSDNLLLTHITEKCPLNPVAFYQILQDYRYLDSYWKQVLNYNKDYAVEAFEIFYKIDVSEFYDNLLTKLNLNNYLSETEKKWYIDKASEINQYFKTINKYKLDNNFNAKVFAKLSIPIDNLKIIYNKLEEFKKRCKE